LVLSGVPGCTYSRLVAVNNIDGRQSMVGVPAQDVVVSHLPSCGGRLLGGAPAAVWLLLTLSGAYWENTLQ
jgi:hypothetical protein